MNRWLLKTEPDDYSYADLVRDKQTVWDGVANYAALKNIRAIKKGDEAIIYHTGNVRSAIGIAKVTSDPYADPREDDEKLVVVDVKPVKALKTPVTLAQIKADPVFEGWDLIRIGRLSVVPVPEAMWQRLEELSQA